MVSMVANSFHIACATGITGPAGMYLYASQAAHYVLLCIREYSAVCRNKGVKV